ncbi:hypothetical protein HS088_TW12G00291 [Tripterygium wilfordii]|uniref:Uncharacterized protein n=1 Tax=Tripterygium wilfordii TaxID=458696 RepID=A0A7J7CYB4_TRIWF|nr:hypothetical protein HS088_TW12G00291 [Tripterygium wilfordii]
MLWWCNFHYILQATQTVDSTYSTFMVTGFKFYYMLVMNFCSSLLAYHSGMQLLNFLIFIGSKLACAYLDAVQAANAITMSVESDFSPYLIDHYIICLKESPSESTASAATSCPWNNIPHCPRKAQKWR